MNKFKIFAGKLLFNSHIFKIPTDLWKEWDSITKGILELDDKKFPLTISGTGKYTIEKDGLSYNDSYRAIISECGNEFEVLFCHTFMTLQNPEPTNKSKEKDKEDNREYVGVEFNVVGDTVFIKVTVKSVITNEYTNYFKELAKRNEIALSVKHDSNLKSLIKYSSDWMPIDKLDNHKTVKKCIYMWADENKQYIYVGKADDLVKRIKDHIATPKKDKADCIRKYGDTFEVTHFRYDTVNPFVADTLLEALEMRSIQTIANLLPNRSKGKQKIKGLLNNSKWKQINNQYSYH